MRSFLIGVLTIVFSLGGCGMFANVGEPEQYTMWGSELVLAWDPPSEIGSADSDLTYSLYVRQYPAWPGASWTKLGVADPSNRYIFRVRGTELAPGTYEFGVQSIDADGNRSEMHASTDWDADPATGWVLNWLGGAP